MEQEIIVSTRSEFNSKIKELFIPHLLRTDMSTLIDNFKQAGMFKVWDMFFLYRRRCYNNSKITIMNSKYYMFRDLDNEANLEDERTYHAAGLVQKIHTVDSKSGKDVSVIFLDPFTGCVIKTWRATKEIEIFEVDSDMYKNMQSIFSKITTYTYE